MQRSGEIDLAPRRNQCGSRRASCRSKRKYGLTMDDAERAALEGVLARCSDAEAAASSCPSG